MVLWRDCKFFLASPLPAKDISNLCNGNPYERRREPHTPCDKPQSPCSRNDVGHRATQAGAPPALVALLNYLQAFIFDPGFAFDSNNPQQIMAKREHHHI